METETRFQSSGRERFPQHNAMFTLLSASSAIRLARDYWSPSLASTPRCPTRNTRIRWIERANQGCSVRRDVVKPPGLQLGWNENTAQNISLANYNGPSLNRAKVSTDVLASF